MSFPRVTIATLAMIVVIAAFDCVLLRSLFFTVDQDTKLTIRSILAMANVLPIAIWRLGKRRGPFLLGFASFGLAASTAQVLLFRLVPRIGFRFQFAIEESVGRFIWSMMPRAIERPFLAGDYVAQAVFLPFYLTALASLMAVPQFLIALSGGFFTRRLCHRNNDLPKQAASL